MAQPAGEIAAGRGHLRTSRADRDQVIGMLEAAFVQGLLTRAEFDLRADRTLASRTYADLAAATAGLPARSPGAPPPRQPLARPGNAAAWGVCGLIATAFATVLVIPSGTTRDVVLVTAVVSYAVFWLLAGIMVLVSRRGWAHLLPARHAVIAEGGGLTPRYMMWSKTNRDEAEDGAAL